MIAFGLLLAAWVFTTTTVIVLQRARGGAGQLRRQPLSFWGMVLAHLGVGVFIVGVTMVRGYETERDVKMAIGDHVSVGGYRFTFRGVTEVQGPNYVAGRGLIEVQSDSGGKPFMMHPEKRLYKVQQMPMTEAAIRSGLTRDLYVSLGEMLDDKTWTVRVYHKPFVDWIWGGCFIMALGGLLAAADRRYRVPVKALDLSAMQAPIAAATPPSPPSPPVQPQPVAGA